MSKTTTSKRNLIQFLQFFMMLGTFLGIMAMLAMTLDPFSGKAILVDDNGEPIAITSVTAASRLCTVKTQKIFSDRLSHTYIDNHSTRYDQPREMFLVLMYATETASEGGHNYRIYCHVVPSDFEVSYYKMFVVNN